MNNRLMHTLTIQSASERLQLPKSTLRYWEKEFSAIITPERTPGGQRRYSVKDLAVFEVIKDLKKKGLSLTQIKTHLTEGGHPGNGIDPEMINQLTETIVGAVRRELFNLLKQGN